MARKIYRTMQGKPIDIERFISSNEMIQAVGNMKVNARGDVLGPGGKILKTREQVMTEYYRDNPSAVKDEVASNRSTLVADDLKESNKLNMPEINELSMEDQEIDSIKKSYSRKKES